MKNKTAFIDFLFIWKKLNPVPYKISSSRLSIACKFDDCIISDNRLFDRYHEKFNCKSSHPFFNGQNWVAGEHGGIYNPGAIAYKIGFLLFPLLNPIQIHIRNCVLAIMLTGVRLTAFTSIMLTRILTFKRNTL